MEFLKNIGIDLKLLIAQLINFGILLWILTRFLYKPVIEKIEENERLLNKAKQKEKDLKKKLIELKKTEKETIRMAKLKSKEIIKEAEEIAKKIKKESEQRLAKEKEFLKKELRTELEEERKILEEKIEERLKEDYLKKFAKKINTLPFSVLIEFQKGFYDLLLERVNELKKEAEVSENEVVLESARLLEEKELKKLKEVLNKKFQKEFKINQKENKDLLLGFRLEINGIMIEANLLDEIKF